MKLAILVLAVVSAADPGADEARKDPTRMQGTWNVVVCRVGKTRYTSPKGGHTWLFKGDKVGSTYNGMMAPRAASFRLDATKSPREFDFTDEQSRFEGIYEFEGKRLRICYNKARRPSRFDAEERGERPYNILVELERK
jgi:uncharacterized protein (TIGR03067 family)